MSTNPVKEKNHFKFIEGSSKKAADIALIAVDSTDLSPANFKSAVDAKANEIKADALNNPPTTPEGVEAEKAGLDEVATFLAPKKAPEAPVSPDTLNAQVATDTQQGQDSGASTNDVETAVSPTSRLSPDMVSALLGVCVQLARAEAEGTNSSEEDQISRANEIFNDASLDNPQTDAGKQAKTMAQVTLTQNHKPGVPDMKPVQFDYDALRDSTSIPACSEILAKIGELSANLPIPQKPTAVQEDAIGKAYDAVSLATFDILDKHNIGMSEYKFIFDTAKAVISALEDVVMQQVVGHRHEINSRLFGAKNPGTGKFDANYATYANLKATLEATRANTGGNLNDYFNKEQPAVDAPVAPVLNQTALEGGDAPVTPTVPNKPVDLADTTTAEVVTPTV